MSSWSESIWTIKSIKRLFDFDNKISSLSKNINTYINNTTIAQSRITNIENQLDGIDSETIARINEVNEQISVLSSTLSNLQTKADSLDAEIDQKNEVFISPQITEEITAQAGENSICFIVEGV